MVSLSPTPPKSESKTNPTPTVSSGEKILCPHCRRTASNGVTCKGICVADNDY